MRSTVVVVLAVALLTGIARGGPGAGDLAVWVYGDHSWSSANRATHLFRLPAGTRRLYLSVEDGPRLLLDDPASAHQIAHDRFGLAVEAVLGPGDPEQSVRAIQPARCAGVWSRAPRRGGGFARGRLALGRLVPGRLRELPPLVLERER